MRRNRISFYSIHVSQSVFVRSWWSYIRIHCRATADFSLFSAHGSFNGLTDVSTSVPYTFTNVDARTCNVRNEFFIGYSKTTDWRFRCIFPLLATLEKKNVEKEQNVTNMYEIKNYIHRRI